MGETLDYLEANAEGSELADFTDFDGMAEDFEADLEEERHNRSEAAKKRWAKRKGKRYRPTCWCHRKGN